MNPTISLHYHFTYNYLKIIPQNVIIDNIKGKHPLQSGCSEFRLKDVLTDTAYPVGRQDRHFYFRLLSLLLRKASNAIIKLPKDISNANIPMKIEMIS